jgi:hypothetical protein
MDSHF